MFLGGGMCEHIAVVGWWDGKGGGVGREKKRERERERELVTYMYIVA